MAGNCATTNYGKMRFVTSLSIRYLMNLYPNFPMGFSWSDSRPSLVLFETIVAENHFQVMLDSEPFQVTQAMRYLRCTHSAILIASLSVVRLKTVQSGNYVVYCFNIFPDVSTGVSTRSDLKWWILRELLSSVK